MGRQPSEYDEQRAIREAVVAHRQPLLASLRQLVRAAAGKQGALLLFGGKCLRWVAGSLDAGRLF